MLLLIKIKLKDKVTIRRVLSILVYKNFQNLYFNLEMEEVKLSYNLTELLNLSGDCGVALSPEAVETINYYRYYFKHCSLLLLNENVVTKLHLYILCRWLLIFLGIYDLVIGESLTGYNFRPILLFTLCRWMICGIGFSLLTFLGLLGNITSLIILSNRLEKFNYGKF